MTFEGLELALAYIPRVLKKTLIFLMQFILFMGLFVSISIAAPNDDEPTCCSKKLGASSYNLEHSDNGFLDFLYGKAPKNGIIYQPFGMHTKKNHRSIAKNELVGVVFNSFVAGTFINSFHDRTWYLVVMRNIYESHGFGVDYFAGVIYGYEGKLKDIHGIPLRNSFLWSHNLNPLISLDAWYKISNHIQLQVTLTPLVVLGGFKYNF